MTFLALVFLVMALAVFSLQALYFLKEGGILPVSVVDGLQALHVPWASDPKSLEALDEVLKSVPLTKAQQREVDDFERAREYKCPDCGSQVSFMGQDFKAPKKSDVKAWVEVEAFIKSGKVYYRGSQD